MAQFRTMVVTDAGLALAAAAAADGKGLVFSSMRTGSGSYDGTEDLSAFTALRSQQTSTAPSSVSATDSQVRIAASVSNAGITAGFYLTEIGIFAYEEGGSASDAVLFAITSATSSDWIPAYADSPRIDVIEAYVGLTNAGSLTFTVASSDVYALANDLNALDTEVQALQDAGFITGADYHADNTPEDITILTSDWTASGSNYVCTKACSKATADSFCRLDFYLKNPSTMTAENAKAAKKALNMLYPAVTVGAGTVTFTAWAQPTVTLYLSVVGGTCG